MFWMTLLVWAVSLVAYELIRPKPRFENQRPYGLGEFQVPTATEGRLVPIIWGLNKLSGPNIIWYGNLRANAVTREVSTGLFSSQDVVEYYNYFMTIVFAFCQGPCYGIHTVWANDKIVAGSPVEGGVPGSRNVRRNRDDQTGEVLSVGINGTLWWYPGTDDQAQSTPFYDALSVSAKPFLPDYRGIAYAVIDAWIGKTNSMPTLAFEVSRFPDPLNLAAMSMEHPHRGAVNPANVLYELLANSDWGLGVNQVDIDVDNFKDVAGVLHQEQNGFAMVVDGQMEVADIVNEVLRQIDGVLYFDRNEALWRVRLIRDDYDPGDAPLYDETNIIELVEYGRQAWEETVNEVRVSFTRAAVSPSGALYAEYKETSALAQDSANIELQGGRINSVDLNYPGCKSSYLANQIAQRELRVQSYPLAKVSFKINRQAFNLPPAGVFRLSWDRLGIVEGVFRVAKINYGKLGKSEITVSATQDIFAVDSGAFGDPDDDGIIDDPVVAPVAVEDYVALEAPRQIVVRDPFMPTYTNRVWCCVKRPDGGEGNNVTLMKIRFGTSRPLSGDFEQTNMLTGFALTGTLNTAVEAYGSTDARPHTASDIVVSDDDGDVLDDLVEASNELAVESLNNLCFIENEDPTITQAGEWIGYEEVQESGGLYLVKRLWRGLFNTCPQPHPVGARIWFVKGGVGGLTNEGLGAVQDEVDVRFDSPTGEDDIEGPVAEISMVGEYLRMLPPRDPVINNAFAPSAASMDTSYPTETGRTGEDSRAMKIEWTPRDNRVESVIEDDELSPEYEGHRFAVDLYSRTNPLWNWDLTDPIVYLPRNDIIKGNMNEAPEPVPSDGWIRVVARRPGVGGDGGPGTMWHFLELTTALTGISHGGVHVDGSAWSNFAIEYGETGTYDFDIYTALPSSGTLEANVNSGGWVTVISAGNTTGTLAVTAGDMVELRTTQAPAADQFFSLAGPGSEVGYGVLVA